MWLVQRVVSEAAQASGDEKVSARENSVSKNTIARKLIEAADNLSARLGEVEFQLPVHTVYNPFVYAREAYCEYLRRYATTKKRVFYLGMNPGPWGMAQTGIPFGEVAAVRNYLQITARIGKPLNEHPKRPIEGMECGRSEVSGRRLWGLFSKKYPSPEAFFEEQFVANYCPLVFMDQGARNVTPDKLPAKEFAQLAKSCDLHLAEMLAVLKPDYVVGIGQFAEVCLGRVAAAAGLEVVPAEGAMPSFPKVGILRILHPSPASPAANRDWAGVVEKTLLSSGVWQKKG